MLRGRDIARVALLVVALALCAAGCGSGSNSSSSSGSADSSAKTVSSFSKSKYAKYGEEATAAEREAASQVLERNLRARAAGDWAVQCSTLTPGAIYRMEEPTRLLNRKGGCVPSLKLLAKPLKATKALRADTLSGPIGALRVKGDRAVALYHGNDGKDYAIPLVKVDGEWKVNALLTTEAQ